MRRYFSLLPFLILACIVALPAHGQEAIAISKLVEKDKDISVRDITRINDAIIVSDTLDGWQVVWMGGLNGAQAAYNNWSGGGANSISVTISTVFGLRYRKDKFAYAMDTNLKYGKARIAEEGTRKTDDRIAINNKFSYQFNNEKWSVFANVNFSTQFDRGFDYGSGNSKKLISSFFSPAYFTQIAGVAFTPVGYFSAQAGVAMKETIVANDALTERYGLYHTVVNKSSSPFFPGQYGVYSRKPDNFRFEPGYSTGLFFEKTLFSNIKLVSSAETFTNLQKSIASTDVHFSNELVGKINDFMNMSFQFVMIYDDDYSKKVQVKQVLSAGLSVTLL